MYSTRIVPLHCVLTNKYPHTSTNCVQYKNCPTALCVNKQVPPHKHQLCTVQDLHQLCTVQDLHQLCTVQDLHQLCTVQDLHQLCTVQDLHQLCTVQDLHQLCTVQDLHQLCTVQDLHQLCTVQDLHQLCTVQDMQSTEGPTTRADRPGAQSAYVYRDDKLHVPYVKPFGQTSFYYTGVIALNELLKCLVKRFLFSYLNDQEASSFIYF